MDDIISIASANANADANADANTNTNTITNTNTNVDADANLLVINSRAFPGISKWKTKVKPGIIYLQFALALALAFA